MSGAVVQENAIDYHETAASLTVAITSDAYKTDIVSPEKGRLEIRNTKIISTTSLFFTVENTRLSVSYSVKQDDEDPVEHLMFPNEAGILARYIHPDMVERISAFLDKAFPGVETKELNPYELDYVGELVFGNGELGPETPERVAVHSDLEQDYSSVAKAQKLEICNLISRLVTLSFPVYVNFVPSRINDGFYETDGPSSFLEPYHTALTYREFLMELFGVYRKDLAKAVINCETDNLIWMSRFKDILDIEAIIEGLKLESHVFDQWHEYDMHNISDFPKLTIKKLMFDAVTSAEPDSHLVRDALNMSLWVPPERVKECDTWKKLHDIAMSHYAYNGNLNDEIPHGEEFERFFSEAEIDNMEIVPLRTAGDFVDTGNIMDVCVGSLLYIEQAYRGDGYCFRIDGEDKKPYALLEVRKGTGTENLWRVTQCYGPGNEKIPTHEQEKFEQELGKFIQLKGKTNA